MVTAKANLLFPNSVDIVNAPLILADCPLFLFLAASEYLLLE